MGPIASAAARSGFIAIAVFLLFVATSVVMMDAPMEYRLGALQRSFTDMPFLTTLVTGWLTLLGWVWLERRKPPPTPRSPLIRVGWATFTTLLAAAGIVALYEVVYRLFGGFQFASPWRYWLRLFEAALFAVAVVRIALPLLPRFDRMASHGK